MRILFFLLLLCMSELIHAQPVFNDEEEKEYEAKVELQAIGTTNNQVPFWMRTNQYGSIPLRGVSGSVIAQAKKKYLTGEDRPLVDWGFGLEGRVNAGYTSRFILTEAYFKARVDMLEVKAGRSKEIIGITDSTLSSGAFAISGNTLGIPKVEVGIPEYWSIPFTNEFVAIKGNYAHGWFGETPVQYKQNIDAVPSYFHQKSLYIRLGKPESRLKLAGGFNHQAMWGNERQIEGAAFGLSQAQTYWYVIRGKAYGATGVASSKIGNHLGTIDQEISYAFNAVQVNLYHQFFYDVGGLYHGNNLRDGLFGVVFRNLQEQESFFGWKKVLLEYMGSKSQGGELDAPPSPSGDENYYNSYIYQQGWTYRQQNIGNNFLTNKWYGRKDLVQDKKDMVINNRVFLWHLGIEGFAGDWDFNTKLSFSYNYGTYATSPEGSTTGSIRVVHPPPYFERVRQFSAYLEANRFFSDDRYKLGIALSVDQGNLLYNSIGGIIKLSRHW